VPDVDEAAVVLGFDIGGTNVRLGLVTSDNRLIEPHQSASGPLFAGSDPMARFRDFITKYLTDSLLGRQLHAISGGFPSTVSADRRRVISTANIPALQNLPVAEDLAAFRVPVIVDRDTNNLLRFDLVDHQLPECGVVIGCYLGTGLGNAIAINGRMLVGRHGVAGELGHVPVHANDRVCGCGNRGCVETVASGRALQEGLLAHGCDSRIDDVFTSCGEEEFVQNVLVHAARAVAAEINILDPDAVVLGGGVVQMKDFPRQRFQDLVLTFVRKPLPADDTTFVYSRPGHHNGVLGAGLAAWDSLNAQGAAHHKETK
jgi:allose kinase